MRGPAWRDRYLVVVLSTGSAQLLSKEQAERLIVSDKSGLSMTELGHACQRRQLK
jgi:hypothetical protein